LKSSWTEKGAEELGFGKRKLLQDGQLGAASPVGKFTGWREFLETGEKDIANNDYSDPEFASVGEVGKKNQNPPVSIRTRGGALERSRSHDHFGGGFL